MSVLWIAGVVFPSNPPPGDSHEVHEGSASTPSIFVVTPDDGEGDHMPSVLRQQDSEPIRMSALPRSTVQTTRPPLKS